MHDVAVPRGLDLEGYVPEVHVGAVEDVDHLQEGGGVQGVRRRVSLDHQGCVRGAPHIVHPQAARQSCALRSARGRQGLPVQLLVQQAGRGCRQPAQSMN